MNLSSKFVLCSLVDLNTVNKRKRGTCDQSGSSSDSSSSKVSSKERVKKTKPKQLTEKEATLLDFLDKMKNGENELNFSADETEENNENPEIMAIEVDNIDEHLIQANEAAKDLLNQSSDSENGKPLVFEYMIFVSTASVTHIFYPYMYIFIYSYVYLTDP